MKTNQNRIDMMTCTATWNNDLTTSQRKAWNKSAPKGLTGFNHFLQNNMNKLKTSIKRQ